MFAENLDVFFQDMGCAVAFGALTTTGLLDMPGELVLDGIVSNDYMLTFQTAKLPGLGNRAALQIAHPAFGAQPVGFTVRDVRAHGDGAMSVAYLSKT